MTLLSRDQVKAPTLPKETVACPALGGDVVVVGLVLSQHIALAGLRRSLGRVRPGETPEEAASRAGGRLLAETLTRCVRLADGEPVYTADEWETWGAQNVEPVMDLFAVCERLNGNAPEAIAKN